MRASPPHPPDDPDKDTCPERRRPRWRPTTITTWHASRRGRWPATTKEETAP